MLVGGMMGAIVGIKNMPKNMLERIWSFDSQKEKYCKKRPDFLSISKFGMMNVNKLIQTRPKKCLLLNEERIQ